MLTPSLMLLLVVVALILILVDRIKVGAALLCVVELLRFIPLR